MRCLVAILVVIPISFCCPQAIEKLCKCEDLHNGVSLDCSNANFELVMQQLRQNQASLGLIQHLIMRQANIKRLQPNFLSGIFVKQLDISHNQISEIADNAFESTNSVTHELILHHNNLTKVPVEALSALTSLFRLDLSNNSIFDLKESDAFPALPKLFDINLGSNKVCSVHSSVFQKVKSSLTTINLGNNCLTGIPASAIRGLTQLQSMHLHKNNITYLDSLNFLNLPVLNLLNLANNNIRGISRQAFLNVPNLRYLYLTGNNISTVEKNQFSTFERMEMLDLTRNNIKHLTSGSFSGLAGLRELYLGGNKIVSIEKGTFSKSATTVLVLSDNQLEAVKEGMFDDLPTLQQLSLKNNKIKTIDGNAFYNISSVVMLDMSNNNLSTIPASAFLAQLNLLLVDLSKNNISQTPYNAFNQRIGTVMLQENPLVCSEKVHMIQDGVGVYVPNSDDVVCGGKPKTTTQKPKSSTLRVIHMQLPSKPQPIDDAPQENLENTEDTPSDSDFSTDQEEEKVLLPSRSDEQEEPKAPRVITRNKEHRGLFGSDVNLSSEQEHKQELEVPEQSGPEEADVVQNNHQEEQIPVEPEVTTVKPPRRYTDLADNPHAIHPFPVPFLKRPPPMGMSRRVNSSATSTKAPEPLETQTIHTLPPSIVIAPRVRPTSAEAVDHIEQFALQNEATTVSAQTPKRKNQSEGWGSTPIIVTICITSVVLVMVTVCLVLCIMRYRSSNRYSHSYSDSAGTPTMTYGHAHANPLHGTLRTNRSMMPHEEIHPWIYNPGPNYSNYYK